MTNQIQTTNQNVVQNQSKAVRIDDQGKYRGVAQYEQILPVSPAIISNEIKLFNIMSGNDSDVIPLSDVVGKQIKLVDIMTNPYSGTDEDTGFQKAGVVTTIFDENGNTYATSSANVYFTLNNAFKMFGFPGSEKFLPLTFDVFKEKIGNSPNKSMCLRLVKRG